MSEKIDELLEKYDSTRAQIKELEEKMERYKGKIDDLMASKNTDRIMGSRYAIKRSMNTRTYLSKDDMPRELWTKYSTSCTFPVYRLTKI
jgi:predicted  nucleic acid-binding Zn-ribbon protein